MDAGTQLKPLDLGHVLSTTFKVLRARAGVLFAVAALCLTPAFIAGFLANAASEIVREPNVVDPDLAASLSLAAALLTPVSWLITLVLTFFCQAAMLFISVESLGDRNPTIGAAMGVALRRFFPVLFTSVLSLVAIFGGMIACIVPGVLIMVILHAAVPAAVAEPLGPVAAFQRSSALTRGHRVDLFVLLLIFGLVWFVIALATTLLTFPLVVGGFTYWQLRLIPPLIDNVKTLVQTVFSAVLASVVYVRLRTAHDGVKFESLTSVFE